MGRKRPVVFEEKSFPRKVIVAAKKIAQEIPKMTKKR
jgi:hypothetical protein